jgi:hypothetical protein
MELRIREARQFPESIVGMMVAILKTHTALEPANFASLHSIDRVGVCA